MEWNIGSEDTADLKPANMTASARPGRIPALDGLRGFAILMVITGHLAMFGPPVTGALRPVANFLAQNNGTGVDLFFVLSGFLISGILLDTQARPSYFRTFYIRRTLRIFPLYYAVLGIVLVATLAFPSLYALNTISASAQIANWTYTTNILMAARGWGAEPLFLGHFWSLAVEEQFYLVWPAVILLTPVRRLVWVCYAGIAGALLLRVWLIGQNHYEAAYVLLPSRMDALLIGALLAVGMRRKNPIPGFILSNTAFLLSAVVFAVDAGFSGNRLSGFSAVLRAALHFSITSVFFGMLLLRVLTAQRRLWLKPFTSYPMRFLGKHSYAIYVVHLAVIVALPKIAEVTLGRISRGFTELGPLAFWLFAFGLSVAAALVTWYVIENPALRLKERITDGRSTQQMGVEMKPGRSTEVVQITAL
jgi:peptidoglycan/LPS O-acetylase OafA/YrhL